MIYGGDMSTPLQPTTRAQVSGHRFLRRRVEHGLAFGDIRMIHDPLAARARGMIFGTVAVVLGMLGAGLFAWLNPQPDPGDAPILRSESGALFVRIDDHLHPVINLASARLAVGSPADPVAVGSDYLAAADKGVPVGINPAPGVIADPEDSSRIWASCTSVDGVITVLADGAPVRLPDGGAVLAEGPTSDWVLTADGRRELPADTLSQGRVLRRGLGITPETPRLAVPAEVLSAMTERPAWAAPEPLPTVLTAGEQSWALNSDSAVAGLTPTQADILTGLGAERREVAARDISRYADAVPVNLPAEAPEFLDPVGSRLCGLSDGTVGRDGLVLVPGAVALSGDAPASYFAGLAQGAVAVDSGHGLHVVSPEGMRFPASPEALAALGITGAEAVDWSIVAVLPEGPTLSAEYARRAVY